MSTGSTGSQTGDRVVPTICGACHNSCGMLVHVRDGVIQEIKGNPDHPMNRGTLCVKGRAMAELTRSPQRLKRPLKRVGRRGEGRWQEIPWDEALDLMAARLGEIASQYGPETLLYSCGAPVMEFQRYGFSEFRAQYGTPNQLASNLCSWPLTMALESVCGFKSQPDYDATNLIIMWGGNPWASMRPGHNIAYGKASLLQPITDAVKRGVPFIVIDPVHSETAARATQWIPLRPGTDGALALAMLHVIINQNLYDAAFVQQWTVGFDQLREHVQQYKPDWAADVTGLTADQIRDLAVLYATTKPATIRWGNTFANHTNITQALRAGGCLEAITGNLDVPGGDLCYPTELRYKTTTKPSLPPLGQAKYPLLWAGPSVLDAMLTGEPYQPRALLAVHTNLVSHAGYARVAEAVRRLDFVAVMDIFPTQTCHEFADLVLPDTSFLERYDWRSYPTTNGLLVALRQPAIAPLHESRPVYEVELALAQRMGFAAKYPWHSVEELFAYHLGYVGLDLPSLRQSPVQLVGYFAYRKFEKGLLRPDRQPGFNTPSGKVELYSQRFAGLGYEPLPTYHEPAESPVSTPEVARDYPLIGVNRRPLAYVHYKYRNIPALRKLEPEPCVRLSPDDAGARGIANGEWVTVSSPRGRIRMKAVVSDKMRDGVVWIDGGWGNPWDYPDANINVLTDNQALDPQAQCASISSFLCQVAKE
ncbi:MAG: molybdopterin-dependent oxidoreductase [Chloroflexota bacterium]|nr:molybdopterin-dependent oxidoreductase [Chloroflexota bacterium]